jgi:hypothetical protein
VEDGEYADKVHIWNSIKETILGLSESKQKNDYYLITSLIRRKQWSAVKQQSTSLFGKF